MAQPVPYLIKTKLSPPQPSDDAIERPRLLNWLRRHPSRALTLVCAQAGAGKSTLLAQWLRNDPRPVAWLSLDAGDSTPATFVTYLIAAIQGAYPAACPSLLSLIRDNLPLHADVVSANLINDLADLPGDLVLVLEDYYVIHNPDIHQILVRLLERRPPRLHLVISTRSEPPLMLNSLRASGQVVEVRQRDLRFDRDEIVAFLGRALDLVASPETLDTLQERTEGWGVGLRLAVLSVQTGSELDALAASLRGTQRHVAGYLTDEVLAHLRSELQDFLLRTSILSRFSAPLCAALLDDVDQGRAETLIHEIEEANLFLLPLDGERRWYRYHHLFRDLLAARLGSGNDVRELHRRAGYWLADAGLVDEALHHLLASGEVERAADLVEQHAQALLNRNDVRQLDAWLQALPANVIEQRPALLLRLAWSDYYAMNEALLLQRLERARALIDAAPAAHQPLLRAQGDALASVVAINQSNGAAAMRTGLAALAVLPKEESFVRGIAFMSAHAGMKMEGDAQGARYACDQALAQSGGTLDAFVMRVLMTAGYIHIMDAGHEQLMAVGRHLLTLSAEHNVALGTVWARFMLGFAAMERCRFAEAREHFLATQHSTVASYARPALNARLALAMIEHLSGAHEEADRALAAALLMAQTRLPSGVNEVYTMQASLALARGDLLLARQLLPTQQSTASPWRLYYAIQLPDLVRARVLIAEGAGAGLVQACQQLDKLLALVRSVHVIRFEIEVLLVKAELQVRLDKLEVAERLLEQALQIAEPGGSMRPFLELAPALLPLMRRLQARNVAPALLPRLLALLANAGAAPVAIPATPALVEALTNRELDVLELLAQRLSNQEIADALVVTPNTVRTHLNHIFEKLGANGRRDAVVKARAHGLIP